MHQCTSPEDQDTHLLELFPELQQPLVKIVPKLAVAATFGQDRDMCPAPPGAEACSGTEETRKAEEPSPLVQPQATIVPAKKPKMKGRSHGEKSSRSIKALRKQAAKGDLESAMKLGWSVARITDIFNQNKRARGEKVSPGQPIDDDEILARIAVRQKSQAEIQKRRQDNLRKKAYEGDYEAAKKLKMGKRRMREIFPQMFNFGSSEEGEKNTKTQVAEEPRMPTQAYREGTPAEPRNFEFERHMDWLAGLPAPDEFMPCDVMGSASYQGHDITGDAFACRPVHLKASPPSTQVSLTPPSYPIPNPARLTFVLDQAHEDKDSMQFLTAGQEVMMKIHQKPEYAKKNQEAKVSPYEPNRKELKTEGAKLDMMWFKKSNKPRPSNFPVEKVGEESQEANGPNPMPKSLLVILPMRGSQWYH